MASMEVNFANIVPLKACRCGHSGNGQHPCHALGYSCRKPAKQRFYGPKIVSLSGQQMKLEVSDTWACDECWASFAKELAPVEPVQPMPVNSASAIDRIAFGVTLETALDSAKKVRELYSYASIGTMERDSSELLLLADEVIRLRAVLAAKEE